MLTNSPVMVLVCDTAALVPADWAVFHYFYNNSWSILQGSFRYSSNKKLSWCWQTCATCL